MIKRFSALSHIRPRRGSVFQGRAFDILFNKNAG
jgi:hypothetical protein